VNIASSYHRNIVRHAKACIVDRLHGANGDRIVKTKNSVRHRPHAQKLTHALIARLISVPGIDDVPWICPYAAFRQRSQVTFEAIRGDSNDGTAQVANAAAPPFN
jgi:hypothetical protein